MGILVGDGLTVFAGEWVRGEGQHVVVKYRKVSETFKAVGGEPTPEIEESVGEQRGETLYFGPQRAKFRQEPLLSKEHTDTILGGAPLREPSTPGGTGSRFTWSQMGCD